MVDNDGAPSTRPPAPPQKPTITLPPRPGLESLFIGSGFGLSPGPLTLVSSFFSPSDARDPYSSSDSRSFSQLLAGAMASPGPTGSAEPDQVRFKQNRPAGLMISPQQQQGVFMIPPGLSPTSLLDSPGLFPGQGPFGMSHQQALAQVTAQAQANLQMQGSFPSPLGLEFQASAPFPCFTTDPMQQNMVPSAPDSKVQKDPSQFSGSDQISQPSMIVDKPADDGYNWRKYGQKQVKGSEFPRSYYKCTHPSCPVKKKVERSLDGQVTEIIYKGQHNHQPPLKRSKDSGNSNGNVGTQGNPEPGLQSQAGNINGRRDQETSQVTEEHLSSDGEEVVDDGARESERDEDEPYAKRRNTEFRASERASSHRTLTEPKIIVQTTSEVDLLDDGYRWRKYGQKVVKGNPYPRSYYKCTTPGCNVRKHVERAASDPKAVVTTYEGKHNHDVPAARTSSHSTANSAAQLKTANNNSYAGKTDFMKNNQQPRALLQLKEERIT